MTRRQAWNAFVYLVVFGSLVFAINQQRTINKLERKVIAGQVGPQGPAGPRGPKGDSSTRVRVERRVITRRVVVAGGIQTIRLRPVIERRTTVIQGARGPQGERGPQGDKGQKGEKGDPGKDALLPDLKDALCALAPLIPNC